MALDRGFPRPDLTVVFDRVAAHHLEIAGAFPRSSLAVTGSPGLDVLAARVRAIGPADRAAARAAPRPRGRRSGRGGRLEARPARALAAAPGGGHRPAGRVDGPPGRTRLVVKPHPAETADVYADAAGTPPRPFSLAPPALDLATLLAACDLVVTVNSTVAIDAMALGIPALSVGVPNNLTPFVVAGGIAGVYHPSELQPALATLLWDDAARAELVAKGLACAESGGVRTDGGAARRAADALVALADAGARPGACRRAEPPVAAIMVD